MSAKIINYLLKFYFFRSCKFDSTVVFYMTSRVINCSGIPEKIKIGAYSHIRGELLTLGHGGEIRIGEYCYVGENTKIWSGANITIGDRTLISHNVNIFDNLIHPVSPKERHEQYKAIITTGHPENIDLADKPVNIGNDVLIGAQATILKGITIGDGAIVGAGSIVTKNIPPFTIVAGNPAKTIRTINNQ